YRGLLEKVCRLFAARPPATLLNPIDLSDGAFGTGFAAQSFPESCESLSALSLHSQNTVPSPASGDKPDMAHIGRPGSKPRQPSDDVVAGLLRRFLRRFRAISARHEYVLYRGCVIPHLRMRRKMCGVEYTSDD